MLDPKLIRMELDVEQLVRLEERRKKIQVRT